MMRLQDLQVTSPDKHTRDGILPTPENARMWKSSWPVEPTTLYKYSELPRQNPCDIFTLPRDCCWFIIAHTPVKEDGKTARKQLFVLEYIFNQKKRKNRKAFKSTALYLTEDGFRFQNKTRSAIFMHSYESRAVTHIETVLIKVTFPVQNTYSPKKVKGGSRLQRNARF